MAIKDEDLIKELGFYNSLQIWTSFDNERPYRKTMIIGFKSKINQVSLIAAFQRNFNS